MRPLFLASAVAAGCGPSLVGADGPGGVVARRCPDVAVESALCLTTNYGGGGAIVAVGADSGETCSVLDAAALGTPTRGRNIAWIGDTLLLCDREHGSLDVHERLAQVDLASGSRRWSGFTCTGLAGDDDGGFVVQPTSPYLLRPAERYASYDDAVRGAARQVFANARLFGASTIARDTLLVAGWSARRLETFVLSADEASADVELRGHLPSDFDPASAPGEELSGSSAVDGRLFTLNRAGTLREFDHEGQLVRDAIDMAPASTDYAFEPDNRSLGLACRTGLSP
ncbi:MAG: hypothetical protein AAF721_37415 [Myxococcota bacterium]